MCSGSNVVQQLKKHKICLLSCGTVHKFLREVNFLESLTFIIFTRLIEAKIIISVLGIHQKQKKIWFSWQAVKKLSLI